MMEWRVRSGSSTPRSSVFRISAALFAIELLTTATLRSELVGAQMRHLGPVEEEVELADRIDGPGRPDPGPAASQGRWALAGQMRDEATAELGVLVVETRGARLVGDRKDLPGPWSQRHRSRSSASASAPIEASGE